jgi:membrane associated rhomboid family serine protease
MSFIKNFSQEVNQVNKLTLYIVINIAVFLIINISGNIFDFDILKYLAFPVKFEQALPKFWTIITYMFSHDHLGHLFSNMILLYFNGRIFCNLLFEKRFVFVYILSGVSGAIFLLLFSLLNQSSEMATISGASAASLGIICALAIYSPNLPINLFGLFEMSYKYIAMIVFVLFTIIDFKSNTGGKISHFGGAFFGLLYGYLLKNGDDLSLLSYYKFAKKSKLKVVHYGSTKTSINDDVIQKEIDAILDKISKSGYENLTKSEKEKLFKFSQKK